MNARDWASVSLRFADDGEFWTLGVRAACGAAQIANQLRESMESLPATHDEVTRVAADGSAVFVEMVFQGGRASASCPAQLKRCR